MLIIVMTLSKNEKQMLAAPEVISRGFVYVKDSEELMSQIHDTIMSTVNELTEIEMSQWGLIKQMLKDDVGRFIYNQTKRRPMILPIIIEV
jgi:ribonuclease J